LTLTCDQDHLQAQEIFSEVLRTNPQRIDSLDRYSNILHVLKQTPKLSFLAQLTTSVDKFRPETCCVVGNYYSRTSQHEKAIAYFQNAVALDRNFASAWTLLGREFLQLQNTHAAIESYRRAVDLLDRKDYRGWYGLGRTYENLDLCDHALYYYSRAAIFRPNDEEMWQALGACFSNVEKPNGAIKVLKRALVAVDLDSSPKISYQIALLYNQMGNRTEAIAYMQLCLVSGEKLLDRRDEDERDTEAVNNTIRNAQMSLAEWTVESA
jgi:anaphase-promoting complex subunit 8